jgi:hypothetical protein
MVDRGRCLAGSFEAFELRFTSRSVWLVAFKKSLIATYRRLVSV